MDMNDFQQQDLHKVDAEMHCILTCMLMMEKGFVSGDYEYASLVARDISNSFAELARLKEQKEKKDKLTGLLAELRGKTVKIEIVKRWGM